MKNKNLIFNLIMLLVLSAALCIVSYYAAIMATDYDLGQLAYLFLIFLPAAAAIIGVLTNIMKVKWWAAPALCLLVFTGFMLIRYNAVNLAYVLAYMVISLVGYYIAYVIRRIVKR